MCQIPADPAYSTQQPQQHCTLAPAAAASGCPRPGAVCADCTACEHLPGAAAKRLVSHSGSLWRALWLARDAVKQYGVWCCAECSCCASVRQQTLQSPYHLPATCIGLLAAVFGTLICNEAKAWWEAAKSGSSSSQQQWEQHQIRQARWEEAAWKLACSRHDDLPASHYLLLQLAGCSSKALL